MEEKIDRRIKKTKSLLKHGLAQMMLEKNINEISVKELVELADINRSTFYLHYSDIFALMESVEAEVLKEIRMIIEAHPIGVDENTFFFMEDIFQVFEDNKDICKALLGENGDANFIRKIEEIVKENAMKQLEILFPELKSDLNYAFSFCMSGCVGMITQWLFEDGKEDPKHMSKLMFSMTMRALNISKYDNLLV